MTALILILTIFTILVFLGGRKILRDNLKDKEISVFKIIVWVPTIFFLGWTFSNMFIV